MWKNTHHTYGSVSKFLHWTISILIIGMLALGFIMINIKEDNSRYQLYDIHKSIGITILALMIVRLIWAICNLKPDLPKDIHFLIRAAAHAAHYVLYLLAFAVPMSGFVMSCAAGHPPKYFGLFEIKPPIAVDKVFAKFMGNMHLFLAWTILILVVLHFLGALWHHFIHKDDVLRRMLPFCKLKNT